MNDPYTKTMLTLIAFFLGFLCLKDLSLLTNVHAESEAQQSITEEKPLAVRIVNKPQVIIYDISDDIDVELPVTLVQRELIEVNINDVSPNIVNTLPVDAK